jgi:arabinan endo-1,5-alpha-L-arabinosidase
MTSLSNMRIKYLLILTVAIIVLTTGGCGDDDLKPTGIKVKDPTENDTTDTDTTDTTTTVIDTTYTIPTYADDYSSIASWANRDQWNLANVHDPTVVFDGEYYYMYSTDASYGNAHDGKGHYLARRSRDLVNWEFIGMAMSREPAWVRDSLNSLRAKVGLSPIASPVYGFWAPVIRKVGNVYRMYSI